MRIVSIDPSLRNTALVYSELTDGVVKVIDSVTIETEKSKLKQVRASSDLIHRCDVLHRHVNKFLEKHSPEIIFVETPSGSQSASGMKNYGVSCYMIATLTPRAIEVTPTEVKKATVGTKTASKHEMIAWAFEKHPEAPWTLRNEFPLAKQEHMADAIAIIYAGMITPAFDWIKSVTR
jgi:Holliday junction resolvasome RuvABC endonuclease subunit|tara:strand:+ start:2645 stop:3178 length:534 start_codon:yes stop_codon:yes gene_type:complete